LGFTLTYWFVDLKNRGKGLWPFLVFGTNAISAYVLSEILPGLIDLLTLKIHGQRVSGMKLLYSQLFLPFFSPQNASLLSAVCFVLFVWLLMLPLYRKHIIIKL
jgi:predicted acyltransferase